MKELKNKIIEIFEDASFAPYTIEELQDIIGCEKEILEEVLEQLKEEYIIHETKKHRYGLLETFGLYIGTIDIKEKGFGFIACDKFENEFFVPKNDVNHALNKDTVIFRITNNHTGEKDEACVVKIIKRNMIHVVGTITSYYFKKEFVPIDSKMNIYFEITDYGLSVENDVVKVKIDNYIDDTHVKCHVIEILGNKNDVGIDIKAIASKYDFYQEFDKETIECLQDVVEEYYENGYIKELERRPKINKKIITIDGDDAKDLDDAISLEVLDNGNYLLGVYIADVSYFVKEDSSLDKEALYRGTSVYLVDRVIPMLPKKLSNDLCSLNPKTPKLVMACIMEINQFGEVVDYEIKEAVIESQYRMTYNNVNKILSADIELQEKYSDIVDDINNMNELSHILNDMRCRRGSLNFDIPEAKVIVDEEGNVIDVVLRERLEAEKLIEEFMLIANETVANCINQLELPFIYRVHDVPKHDKLKRFNRILNNTSYKLNIKKNQKITPKVLQRLLDEVNEKDYALSTMLLRLMAKAKYDVYNIGHYGLASECYTHFTSPIRRYPDLLVHRLLKKYLVRGEVSVEDQSEMFSMISIRAEQSSKRERDAIECEYEVNDMKKAEYMQNHIGEEFEGTISSVTNFGLFVTLPNTIEGLVRVGSIKDDYYEYHDNLMALIGRNNKKMYRLGDKIKIKVLAASKEKKEIDFVISLKTNKNMIKYSSKSNGRGKYEKRRTSNRRKK